MFKRQKIPARKRSFCQGFQKHREEYWAERELSALEQRFPGKNFQIKRCESCGTFHVERVGSED